MAVGLVVAEELGGEFRLYGVVPGGECLDAEFGGQTDQVGIGLVFVYGVGA